MTRYYINPQGPGGAGLFGFAAAAAGVSASNNAAFGNGLSGTNTTSNITNTNGVTSDPLLGAYYRPTADSPLIGAGAPLDVYPMLDAAGVQFNRVPTIGAFEYVRPRAGRRV